jgi:putative ABC transport system permease protein
MFNIALQSLLARKLRLVTTALAVILGVAFTAGTLVLTDTMSNIFNNLSASVYQGTDALVGPRRSSTARIKWANSGRISTRPWSRR